MKDQSAGTLIAGAVAMIMKVRQEEEERTKSRVQERDVRGDGSYLCSGATRQ